MYRCSYYPCEVEIFRKYVSKEMADFILCVFGPMDEEGHFKDLDRVRKYMSEACYLNALVGEKVKTNDGVLGEEIWWEEFVKARYEDIYMKLVDTKHEYTFDELGEGFIHLLFDFYRNGENGYLTEYEDNKKRFLLNDVFSKSTGKHCTLEDVELDEDLWNLLGDVCVSYIPFHERENRKALSQLKTALIIGAEEYYDDVIYEAYYDEDADDLSDEAPDKERFYDVYSEYWVQVVNDPASYSYEGPSEDIYEEVARSGCGFDSKFIDYDFYEHFLYWDTDFMFVLPCLNEKTNLDSFLKTTSPYLRYNLTSANDIFSFCDKCYSIQNKPLTVS